MSEKENQETYPVKTTHEFLADINREWARFKRGSIFSTIIIVLVLVGFVLGYWRLTKMNGFEVSDLILVGLLAAFLVYTIYLMTTQYRFFRRWENRMKRVYGYEEKLLADDETSKTGEQKTQ
jgi:hypothetical protein